MNKTTKKAVHFGAGNIGRGFVAEFLHKSGYEVIFADVMDSIIEDLQNTKTYTVTEIGAEGEHSFTISNYRAINSKTHEQDVIEEIRTADLVTCAVGPRILKFIAPVISKGIDLRADHAPALAVIACENMIGATDQLRVHVVNDNTPGHRRPSIHERAQFANSAIDRIVPGQDADAGLNVKIESFFEWVVDQTPFHGHHPEIEGVKWVTDLTPYIERKLFTVNTGHAAAAYHGYNRGKKTIHESLSDPTILKMVQATLEETTQIIIAKHEIDHQEQKDYVKKILKRISNPHLEDTVERVGRAPLRKVSRNERFIGPASQLAERGLSTEALMGCFEVALRFQNVEGDEESDELAKILSTQGSEEATSSLTGLEKDHKLFETARKVVEKVQSGSKSKV